MTHITYLVTLMLEDEVYRKLANPGDVGNVVGQLLGDAELRDHLDKERTTTWLSELNDLIEWHEEVYANFDPDFLVMVQTMEETFTEGDDIDIWEDVYALQNEMLEEEELMEMLEASDFMNETKI